MDKEELYKNAFDGIDESGSQEIAEILAEREGKDVEEVHRMLLRQRFKMLMDLLEHGKADVPGIGYFKRVYDDPNRKFKFFCYPEEESQKRQQLMLQQELGGEAGDVGRLPSKEFNVKADFGFPIKEMVEQLAEQRGVPDDELKRTFDEQLKEAYLQLMETGEGILPDFGRIRCADIPNLKDLTFDFNGEMYEIYRSLPMKRSNWKKLKIGILVLT